MWDRHRKGSRIIERGPTGSGGFRRSPVVSVITPTLNSGNRLKRCLESVRKQSYRSVEHIVIDGGSTDGSVNLFREAGNTRWISEPDTGQAHAINKGFRLSTGDILLWLNADDVLCENAIETAVRAFERSGAGWVYGDSFLYGASKGWTWRAPRRLKLRHFKLGSPIPQPSVFVTREALDRVGELPEDLHLLMDYFLWLKLFLYAIPAQHVGDVLSVIEIHARSKSGSSSRVSWLDEYAEVWQRVGRIPEASYFAGASLARKQLEEGTRSWQRIRAAVEAEAASDLLWATHARRGAAMELALERGISARERCSLMLRYPSAIARVARKIVQRLLRSSPPRLI